MGTDGGETGADRPLVGFAEFEDLVHAHFAAILAEYRLVLDNMVLQVARRHPDEPDLLGLYDGIALVDRGDYGVSFGGLLPLPDTITLYYDGILQVCDTFDDVDREIRVTLIHEIAHHFGIDDERLDQLGWA